MAESLLSFDSDGYVRLFFAMAIIICGYGYVIMGVFIRDALSYILMLFGLTGLSALFSFMRRILHTAISAPACTAA